MSTVVMLAVTLLCQIRPEILVAPFSSDPEVLAVATGFLRVISWNFVAVGLIFTCSGMFQAMGNTLPSLFSSTTRMATFALPAFWLASRDGFQIEHIWYLSVVTMAFQAALSIGLLFWQFRKRLVFEPQV
jgi:Na+-driven multidrug efflux pump